jgi:GT2 family glycosyltransferase
MKEHRLSIILHTYYRYECLEQVLKALARQTVRPHEVLVADQTPLGDRPADFYGKFSILPLRLINLDQPSHAPAKNRAAREAEGDLLLFLDDDMEIGDDFLAEHLAVMEEERVDLVCGAVSDRKELPERANRPWHRMDPISIFLKNPQANWSGMVLVTHGGNICVRKDVFWRVGGYDEQIPRMADIELGYRLYKAGAKMFYSPRPFTHHLRWHSGGTRRRIRNMAYTRLLARLYIHRKHFPGWTTRQFILHEFISGLLFRKVLNGVFDPALLRRPWTPLERTCWLAKAWRESGVMLDGLSRGENG